MKPAPFEYASPTSLTEALELLDDPEVESKVLAGGQSLVPLLSMRLARPQRLVDLNAIGDLTGLNRTGDRVQFGAMTRQCDLIAQTDHQLVAHAAEWIGHAAIRSRGTFGGSIAHADPSAELPSVAIACDAQIHATGRRGQRTVAAEDLFEGALQTTLDESELLTEVDLAVPTRWGFAEMARRHGDFALVLAVVTQLADRWRVVVGGIDAVPWRCAAAESLLDAGAEVSDLSEAVLDTAPSFDDLHAPADYRRAMAAHHVVQAATQAMEVPT